MITGVMSGVASLSVLAQDALEVEDVVVTGSYLRGSPLDAPSPVQVVDRRSIDTQGASQRNCDWSFYRFLLKSAVSGHL